MALTTKEDDDNGNEGDPYSSPSHHEASTGECVVYGENGILDIVDASSSCYSSSGTRLGRKDVFGAALYPRQVFEESEDGGDQVHNIGGAYQLTMTCMSILKLPLKLYLRPATLRRPPSPFLLDKAFGGTALRLQIPTLLLFPPPVSHQCSQTRPCFRHCVQEAPCGIVAASAASKTVIVVLLVLISGSHSCCSSSSSSSMTTLVTAAFFV